MTTPTNIINTNSIATVDALDIAIREASDYLNDSIPKGNRIVILNIQSNSPDLSDYIIDELIANAVNDRIFSVVDRQQIDAIRIEQNFQLSGEVDDNEALAIGRFFGAQTIVSGAVNRLGAGYRVRIRALDVQTAQVQGQFNRNIASSPIIASLLENSRVEQPTSLSSGNVFNGKTYVVVNTSMRWTDARSEAERRGGHLAVITSAEENAFILRLLWNEGTKPFYWIGGYADNRLRWHWVTGEPFSYTNWAPGEPNNSEGLEDRLMIYRDSSQHHRAGMWNDTRNDHGSDNINFGFVIEIP